jgi:hypothetical protein
MIPPFIFGKLATPFSMIEDPQRNFAEIMRYAGLESAVWTSEGIRQDYLTRQLVNHTVSVIAGGGVDTAATLTFPAGQLGPSGRHNLQVNDIVRFTDATGAWIQGRVTAVPAVNQVEVLPTETGTDFVAGMVANVSRIVKMGNAWADATDQPRGATRGTYNESYDTQIIKGGVELSGVLTATSVTWYSANLQVAEPGKGVYWSNQMVEDARRQLEVDKSTAHMFTNPDTGNDPGRTYMTGLFYACKNNGVQYQMVGGWNAFSLAQLKLFMGQQLALNTGVSKFAGFTDTETTWNIDTAMLNFTGSLQMFSTSFAGMSDALSVGFNFKSYKIGTDYTLTYSAVADFDNDESNGYDMKGNMFILPDGKVKTIGGNQPFAEMVYVSGNNYSRRYEEWMLGGAFIANKTTENDSYGVFWRCHRGNVLRQTENFGLIQG